jgi:DNA-directed RNA polymerase specialized sigma24 family protein
LINEGNISELTDIQLLRLLCSEKADDGLYEEFVNRFNNEVVEECKRICAARQLHNHIGIEIAGEVFERVRKYKSFNLNELKKPDPHQAILVYLFRYCLNLFADYHNKEKRRTKNLNLKTYFDNLYIVDEEIDTEVLKAVKDRSISIYDKLNEKERKVILADVEHKKHQPYLPDDVIERLADELDIRKDSVRKIRQRAIAKIKKAINALTQK